MEERLAVWSGFPFVWAAFIKSPKTRGSAVKAADEAPWQCLDTH